MKIDCHSHVNGRRQNWGWDNNDKLIDASDKLGIDKLCCSIPIMNGPNPMMLKYAIMMFWMI